MQRLSGVSKRIFAVFAGGMIPLVLFTAILYGAFLHTNQRQSIENREQKMQGFVNNISNEVRRMQACMYNEAVSNNIGYLENFSDTLSASDFTLRINSAMEQMLNLSNVSGYFGKASLYLYDLGVVCDSKGQYGKMTVDEYMKMTENVENGFLFMEDRAYMFCTSAISPPQSKSFILVEFNIQRLEEETENFLISNSGNMRIRLLGKSIAEIENGRKSIGSISLPVVPGMDMQWDYFASESERFMHWIQIIFAIFILVTIIIMIALIVNIYRNVNIPIQRLMSAFRMIENGDLGYRLELTGKNEFYLIYNSFNVMAGKLEREVESRVQREVLLSDARYRQLQAQINPHFLYNTLFILRCFLRSGDIEIAAKLTNHLEQYFRYTCSSGADRDKVPISSEIEHVKNYASIQSMRFGEGLTINIEQVPEEIASIKIPRLTIQPLVENVFKYVVDKYSNSVFSVKAYRNGEEILIDVEDNGRITEEELENIRNRLESERVGGGIAIQNIHQRIRLVYGDESGLRAMRSDLGGLKMEIYIKSDSALLKSER